MLKKWSIGGLTIFRLEDVTRAEVRTVGGKSASLGELLRSGFDVPDGFVLTADTFARAQLVTDDHTREAGGENDKIGDADLCEILLVALAPFGDAPLAVRSSGVDEDGGAASFAGQHETYLNVRGLARVAEAVRGCWRSAHSERAKAYRASRGLAVAAPHLAVLVQRLVAADVSVVAFSANPVTGGPDEVVIDATWGLGESLVGGTVTPDTYWVRKADLTVLQSRIVEKRRMSILASDGTREVDVPRFLCTQPTLGSAQVRAVAQLVLALERQMGWPVDVECSFAGERLYLLQCRPITALSP